MNLGLCIANLLRRYSAVEVPGIGVFKIVRMPASYDPEQSAFLPPTSRIELTEEHADFFPIVNYVRAQRDVDETTATQILEEAVSEVVDAVSRNGRALLDGVGYLIADGASFVFKPFDTAAMEVSPVAVKPADEAAATPEDIAESETDVALSPRKSRTLWWVAAVALVLLVSAAGVIWYYKSGWPHGEKKSEHLVQKEVIPPADSVADSVPADQLQATVVDSARADTVVPVSKPAKPAITYEIIVGSFATMAQARKYVAEMKAKGYDLRALDSRMPGNRKKISWGAYETEEEAYRELARVQKNFEPGAWIAKVENE